MNHPPEPLIVITANAYRVGCSDCGWKADLLPEPNPTFQTALDRLQTAWGIHVMRSHGGVGYRSFPTLPRMKQDAHGYRYPHNA